ncbi:YigZ family protein [Allokutzneria sp. A3M-2-11 16]|uniref:YigZ family protein n=1 Tax=Allokutzneria sp. A3M-2-11 16 TaxID=2962043 RepID=UPI0020B8930F|nr:YigZ family protein [Allokutzneria sp. A3M-2-11 16]MCP3802718.1 YigZ family protein [Allokutzneria sp. A3M-2-11 16]
MRTLKKSGEHELEIKKSRFVCALARVEHEDEAREFIRSRRKAHVNAGHHCSAYVLDDAQRSSDDGEPAGTAGVPMLEVLRRRELTGVVAVVSRHYGGVKLGAGGLIRAYGGVVAEAVDLLGVVERRPVLLVSTVVDYLRAGKLENELRNSRFRLAEADYGAEVRFRISVEETALAEFGEWLAELTAGQAQYTVDGSGHVEVDLTNG